MFKNKRNSKSSHSQPDTNIASKSNTEPKSRNTSLNRGISTQNITPSQLIMLQRTVGNTATQHFLHNSGLLQRDPEDDIPVADDSADAMEELDAAEVADPVATYWGEAPVEEEARAATEERYTGIKGIVASDVKRVAEASAAYNERAKKVLNNLASSAGAELKMGPVKAPDRILEKAFKKIKAGAPVTRVTHDIKDILRCTLVFDDFSTLSDGYKKVVKELATWSGGIIAGMSKMTSGFETKTPKPGEPKKPESGSGYRDAKLIFLVEAPKDARDKLAGMMSTLPTLSIEVQFNVAAALAVKDGKPPGAGADDKWNFERKAGPIGEVFDAYGFLTKLVNDRADDPTSQKFVKIVEAFMSKHADTLKRGLPIAHHLYEPKKLQAIAEYEGISTDEVEAFYNPLYRKLYRYAFQYSKFTKKSGNQLHATIKKLKDKYVSTG